MPQAPRRRTRLLTAEQAPRASPHRALS